MGATWGRLVRPGRKGTELLYGQGGKIKLGIWWDKARGQLVGKGLGGKGKQKPGRREREEKREGKRQEEQDQIYSAEYFAADTYASSPIARDRDADVRTGGYRPTVQKAGVFPPIAPKDGSLNAALGAGPRA